MIVWVYQQCKYIIKHNVSETSFNQNFSIMFHWSVTKNVLKQKERAFKKNYNVWTKTKTVIKKFNCFYVV